MKRLSVQTRYMLGMVVDRPAAVRICRGRRDHPLEGGIIRWQREGGAVETGEKSAGTAF
ncbi:hypothetical protein [Streptomyces sp. NBC_00576]|uniref:hypothetical protein n=1 Tax=Streptomyces sp. NBC_00576 TaxID=2903665 RepID=UPI002E7FCC03|nr:hypothetical protein [Streptomyces sp. NBC_00576]WUB73476.1 hypothetical protein OG734_27245 [Streptomyces sp. NBC_00576]